MIVLRFVSGGDWDSKLIRYWTESKWSHVEAYRDGHTFGAMLKGGVKCRQLTDPEYRNMQSFALVGLPATVEQEDKFWEFLLAQEGKPYDVKGILTFSPALRLVIRDYDWRNRSRWFCSTLMAAATEHAGVLAMPSGDSMVSISPAVLWAMSKQRERFEWTS